MKLQEYSNPVTSLLRDTTGETAWRGMHSISDIRKQEGIPIIINKDSLYKSIERKQMEFKKQKISSSLHQNLPFASKPKQLIPKIGATGNYESRRTKIIDISDKKKNSLLQITASIRSFKSAKRETAHQVRLDMKARDVKNMADNFRESAKAERKRKYTNSFQEQANGSKRAR